jgi:MoaA/NifB/PqqE/SkfB family radical SAM enzyme
MYEPIKKIVIDASNKCSLQCSKCGREWYRNNKIKVPGELLTINRFKKLIEYFDEYVEFCGQLSDATMNPYLPEFLSILYDKKIPSKVSTAATYRNKDWYLKCFNLNPNTEWVFGIDGLPEDSHLYRKNQDGIKLYEIMKLGASIGLKIKWQYIVFRYNENDIDQAMKMAQEIGVIFELNISSRWEGFNDPLIPLNSRYVKKHGTSESKFLSQMFK